ncbi:MAG TPA: zinc-binding dehydrogenase [Thermoanaerobaculia bacterium]|nr:zinc-binding dehydrogenase [Thermoanaerobaculia bacterium]HUM29063.1 zinc-binding dehydrogenase [Thermoanaerobaculia bacterium]HXK67381.1 zinc-binding dehydrogenase [Thermoanaerobaculia bacterium]
MKAVYIQGHGDMEQMKVGDRPEPSPKPGEIKVRIKAASLNHLDLFVLKGLPGLNLAFPHICGADGAGEVVEVNGESSLKPGDPVVLNPGLSCGTCPFCRAGEHSLCSSFMILGEHVSGTFAEFLTVPERNVFPMPGHLSFEEAAAFPLTFLTAYRMLFTRARLQAGQSLLIHGIGGGVSLAAMQMALKAGCRVLVSSGSNAKLEEAMKLGATAGFNYREEKVTRAVKNFTEGMGVDLVVDSVGEKTWLDSIKAVRKGGTIVTCGATTGPNPQTEIRLIFWKQISILGSTMGSDSDFAHMVNLVRANEIKPVVDRVFEIDHAPDAYLRLRSGEQFGNVVLSV